MQIKSFTNLEQSKVLAEILPLESVDMYWRSLNLNGHISWTSHIKRLEPPFYDFEHYTPCWSLAALLGVLPYCPDLSKHTDGKWYITTYPNDAHTCLMAYDNPVDACVDMIIKLHELKML